MHLLSFLKKGSLTMAMLLLPLFMWTQLFGHRHPAPSDPGMRLPKPKPSTPAIAQGPKIPNNESPDPTGPIRHDLPQGGDDKPGDNLSNGAGISNLQLQQFELVEVAPGSSIGTEYGWILVLKGSGFLVGEEPPVVHLGPDVHVYETYLNTKRTELYAVLTPAALSTLQSGSLNQIAVQNPCGVHRSPLRWGRIAVQPGAFETRTQGESPAVEFQAGDFFVEMKR